MLTKNKHNRKVVQFDCLGNIKNVKELFSDVEFASIEQNLTGVHYKTSHREVPAWIPKEIPVIISTTKGASAFYGEAVLFHCKEPGNEYIRIIPTTNSIPVAAKHVTQLCPSILEVMRVLLPPDKELK